MNTDDRTPELDLFHEVLAQPPAMRSAYIEKHHKDNPALADRLRRLLSAHELAQGSEYDASRIANVNQATSPEQMPEWIDQYRVLEVIGQGGMGIVYAAEQASPIRRRVAVKVIRIGMDTEEVIARFEAERQALAMLEHPGIARVFDAGTTDSGRLFFVMELVKGLPLTEYCRKHKLSVNDKLSLFVDVCEAVHHAHQRGIIHRDLKPSNVLVSVTDERPTPKIIDFGVAKATASRLSERAVFTEQGRLIGTPEYMSPEQAEMSSLDVDTRADVYSLGVMLYELLTGVLPFESDRLRSAGFAELQRIIREEDPPRPSSRLSAIERADESPDPSRTIPSKRLRGELDWIVMRAIDKDRMRRYESASAFYKDIKRFLADEPVQAGPPSAAYVFRKYVKRHRYITIAMISAALAVAAGVAGLTIGLIDARRAQALADRRADNALVAADFLQKVLFRVDPEFGGGEMSLREVIDFASRSIETDLSANPEVEASVRESIGVAYRRLSLFPEAEPHLRRSLSIRRELLGDENLQTARSFVAMAYLVFEQSGDIDEAIGELRKASAAFRANGLDGTWAHAWLLLDIGIINLAGDRLAVAEKSFKESARLLTIDRGAAHPDVSRPLRGLAMVALRSGDLVNAESLAREAVALCEGEGAEYIGARAKLVLVSVLIAKGTPGEAGGLLAEAKAQLGRTVGPRHIRMAELDACLAELCLLQGDNAEAERVADRCLEARRALLNTDHWAILEARLLRARARIGQGFTLASDEELLQIEEDAARLLGNDHPFTIAVMRARLDCSRAMGDPKLESTRAERLARMIQNRDQRLMAEEAAEPTQP